MHTKTETPARPASEVLPERAPIAPALPLRLPGLEPVSAIAEQDRWLHEALLGPYSEDILEYLQLARRTGGRVLDLGSGSGRLAVPFAQHGFHVHAVDKDATSLARLRSWAARLGPGTERCLSTSRADLSHLKLDRHYDLAILAGAMVCAVPPGARPGLMHEIASHLSTGGRLALDYTSHDPGGLSRAPRRTWRFQVPRFDARTEWAEVRQDFDLTSMTEHITYCTERRGGGAPVQRSLITTEKWVIDHDALRAELDAAGLHIAELRQQRLDHRTSSVLLVCHAGS